jgi:hypothetical protein
MAESVIKHSPIIKTGQIDCPAISANGFSIDTVPIVFDALMPSTDYSITVQLATRNNTPGARIGFSTCTYGKGTGGFRIAVATVAAIEANAFVLRWSAIHL